MKKLVLTSICALAATSAAFAQGVVQWNLISPAAFTVETNTTATSFISPGGSVALNGGSIGLTSTTPGSFYYELLYTAAGTAAPTTLAGLDGWSDAGLEAQNNSGSAGKTSTINGAVNSTVPFTTASEIMLVGWSSNLGTTWSAASTVLNSATALSSVVGTPLFGISKVGDITPLAAGTSPGSLLFGTGTGQISSLLTPLYVVSVPEPTTIAMGVMGGLSLLALRRKKA